MLVLSRKVGEIIRIDKDIQVIVTEITRGKVKLGILAPADKKIFRQEVYDRILDDGRDPFLPKTEEQEFPGKSMQL